MSDVILIVCDEARGLKGASEIAASLSATRQIQGWELSAEEPGIELKPFPASADVVKEKGGAETYRKYLVDRFTPNNLYREWTPPPPSPPSIGPHIAPTPMPPLVGKKDE